MNRKIHMLLGLFLIVLALSGCDAGASDTEVTIGNTGVEVRLSGTEWGIISEDCDWTGQRVLWTSEESGQIFYFALIRDQEMLDAVGVLRTGADLKQVAERLAVEHLSPPVSSSEEDYLSYRAVRIEGVGRGETIPADVRVIEYYLIRKEQLYYIVGGSKVSDWEKGGKKRVEAMLASVQFPSGNATPTPRTADESDYVKHVQEWDIVVTEQARIVSGMDWMKMPPTRAAQLESVQAALKEVVYEVIGYSEPALGEVLCYEYPARYAGQHALYLQPAISIMWLQSQFLTRMAPVILPKDQKEFADAYADWSKAVGEITGTEVSPTPTP